MRRASRFVFAAAFLTVLAGCDQQSAAPAKPPTPIASTGGSPAPEVSAKPAQQASDQAVPQGKNFDFYVLALSWSPSYCEAEGADANRQQCKSGRPYAFVVHGLWPQFERGFPKDCATSDPDVDDSMLRSLYDLMPSGGLIRHEWRTHGACTGLSQADYFDVLRKAREKVVIPAEFRRLDDYRTLSPGEAEQSFAKANAGLQMSEMAVTCDKRFLREVRICLTTQLDFRDCPEIDRRACRADKVVMPPLRGG